MRIPEIDVFVVVWFGWFFFGGGGGGGLVGVFFACSCCCSPQLRVGFQVVICSPHACGTVLATQLHSRPLSLATDLCLWCYRNMRGPCVE